MLLIECQLQDKGDMGIYLADNLKLNDFNSSCCLCAVNLVIDLHFQDFAEEIEEIVCDSACQIMKNALGTLAFHTEWLYRDESTSSKSRMNCS